MSDFTEVYAEQNKISDIYLKNVGIGTAVIEVNSEMVGMQIREYLYTNHHLRLIDYATLTGGIINFLCALSPVGIVSGVWNLCRYTSKKKCGEVNRKLLAWVIVGPVLTTLLWVSSICAFVYYSGGV